MKDGTQWKDWIPNDGSIDYKVVDEGAHGDDWIAERDQYLTLSLGDTLNISSTGGLRLAHARYKADRLADHQASKVDVPPPDVDSVGGNLFSFPNMPITANFNMDMNTLVLTPSTPTYAEDDTLLQFTARVQRARGSLLSIQKDVIFERVNSQM